MANVYEIVTDRIIEQLEKGVIPWRKPWVSGEPSNLVTKKAYRGINCLITGSSRFSSPWWVTFKQAKDLGGSIKRGEKGTLCVFWLWRKNREEETENIENEKQHPTIRYYTIFNIEQTEGLEKHIPAIVERQHSPIESCEKIVSGYKDGPNIIEGLHAGYNPRADRIKIPKKETFESVTGYYATLFHEMAHSTGHESRLNRLLNNSFGSSSYSKEELIAEMTAAFLSGNAGIGEAELDNNASYIKGWLEVLQSDKRFLIQAAQGAQKAADFILGKSISDEKDLEI